MYVLQKGLKFSCCKETYDFHPVQIFFIVLSAILYIICLSEWYKIGGMGRDEREERGNFFLERRIIFPGCIF
jgi:hypothetical protein